MVVIGSYWCPILTNLYNYWLQDNVFVNVVASVQYRALADKASDAFYKLSNTRSQIQAYVFDGKFLFLTIMVLTLSSFCWL